jgi:polyphosphate glucokinase
MEILGIDVGGSGIKGAPVDTEMGTLLAPRYRIPTPKPAKPEAIATTVNQIAEHFEWQGPIGCGFPAVVQHGVVYTAANIHKSWIGQNIEELFQKETGCPIRVLNDADAAGLAEMAFGAGKDQDGVVLIITLGTGIGTALFTEGVLLPNTELGHIEIRGKEAERRASDATRKRKDLSWKRWSHRVDEYLRTMEDLFWPDLIIVGGGVSKKSHKFFPRLTARTEIVAAKLRNEAGIIGAAMAALKIAQ